jgi:hypothetical protein
MVLQQGRRIIFYYNMQMMRICSYVIIFFMRICKKNFIKNSLHLWMNTLNGSFRKKKSTSPPWHNPAKLSSRKTEKFALRGTCPHATTVECARRCKGDARAHALNFLHLSFLPTSLFLHPAFSSSSLGRFSSSSSSVSLLPP